MDSPRELMLQKIESLYEEYRKRTQGWRTMQPHSIDMQIDFERSLALRDEIDELERSLLPTEYEIAKLPRWARIAFVARCSRRLLPRAQEYCRIDALSEGVVALENAATTGQVMNLVSSYTDNIRARLRELRMASPMGPHFYPADPVADKYATAIATAIEALGFTAIGDTHRVVSNINEVVQALYPLEWEGVGMDYGLLLRLASQDGWTDNTLVSPDIWAVHSTFDIERKLDGRSILDISSVIDQRLINYFHKHPNLLYEITPRQFEELIAEILHGFGFSVELTAQTRDGGRDIIAISHSVARVKYLIECKQYSVERAVGLAPVQRLFGVVSGEQASKGILVTTAQRFTQPARRFIDQHQWLIDGRDYEGLIAWLDDYQALKLRQSVSPDDRG
ncbi:MAG: restriction endonuclease [Chloroflexota bacterium]|nr:restriction endonuclease [Chloroflexota bacterium]